MLLFHQLLEYNLLWRTFSFPGRGNYTRSSHRIPDIFLRILHKLHTHLRTHVGHNSWVYIPSVARCRDIHRFLSNFDTHPMQLVSNMVIHTLYDCTLFLFRWGRNLYRNQYIVLRHLNIQILCTLSICTLTLSHQETDKTVAHPFSLDRDSICRHNSVFQMVCTYSISKFYSWWLDLHTRMVYTFGKCHLHLEFHISLLHNTIVLKT